MKFWIEDAQLIHSSQLSRIWRDRLVGAAAGAAATIATLWFALITIAAAAIILRA